MKIAVPVLNDDQINNHFGKSDKFNIYTIENDKIESVSTIPALEGGGCKSGIASVFSNLGVRYILTSGIGGGASMKLKKAGMEVIRGCLGSPRENVELFIKGQLKDEGSTCVKHHAHDHDHDHDHDHHLVQNIKPKPPVTDLRIKK